MFEKLSAKALVEALMAGDHEKTLTLLPVLIKCRLMRPPDFIALLASSDVFRARLAAAPETYLALARVGEWVATKGRTAIDRAVAEQALNAPLAAAVAFQHPSNLVLRCAHAFDPKRFHDDVIQELRSAPVALDSHYLIVSLLKWGTQPDQVLPHLHPWLAENSKALKASFVYQAWLDAEGEVGAVQNSLLQWVAEHGTTPEASHVYQAWLDAKGEVGAVRDSLLLWLGKHGATLEAEFVYKAWLDAGGEVGAVRDSLLLWVEKHGTTPEQFVYKAWLDAGGEVGAVRDSLLLWVAEHGTTPEARFVYQAWLDAGGEVGAVRDKLLLWVEKHGITAEASHVYQAWLDAKGEVGAVRDSLLLWVEKHGTTAEASHVYKAWLDAGGKVDAVRENLLLWVSEYGTTPEAQFVYQAWLDAKGEVGAVRDSLLLWVAEHGTTPEAQFVYKAWLEAGHPLEPIKTSCEAWLLKHWHAEDAVYVTKQLSKTTDLSREGVACILEWAGMYSTNEDAIFRLSRMSRVFHRHAHHPGFSKLVAKVTTTVTAHLFSTPRLSKGVRDACSILFANFAKSAYPHDHNWPAILEVYCNGLRHGAMFWHFKHMPATTWEVLLHEALSLQLLDPITDAAAIRHAHDLIRQVRSPEEYAALISSDYLSSPPEVISNL